MQNAFCAINYRRQDLGNYSTQNAFLIKPCRKGGLGLCRVSWKARWGGVQQGGRKNTFSAARCFSQAFRKGSVILPDSRTRRVKLEICTVHALYVVNITTLQGFWACTECRLSSQAARWLCLSCRSLKCIPPTVGAAGSMTVFTQSKAYFANNKSTLWKIW